MRKRTTHADDTAVRVVIVTLDGHLAGATERARSELRRDLPGLELALHAASDWQADANALQRCRDDIARGDIIIATMLFMEDHIKPVLADLQRRRDDCDAMVGCMSAGEVIRLTRLGGFRMDGSQGGPLAMLKKLRGSKKPGASSGAKQMAMLRRLPRILRFIPGTAQDVRAYFLTLQYWLAGSQENVANMVRLLIDRYASGPRQGLRGQARAAAPVEYPDVGVYHPRLKQRLTSEPKRLPVPRGTRRGTVGLLVMRSYALAGNTAHYDAVIAALEARGLAVICAFASGLDARPAVERYFMKDGAPVVDAVVSLTGFSLVGGPAYNDASAAEELLARLDVPYLAAQSLEFQSVEEWEASERGLLPVEATMMLAIPELDGATGPLVFGGRSTAPGEAHGRDMRPVAERAEMLAARVGRLIDLRSAPKNDRKVAIVLFNFPPNAGSTGTAAYLSVFESLWHTLKALADDGYDVDVPPTVDALRDAVVEGNAAQYGAEANVVALVDADDHVRREPHLEQIEAEWGPAPGRQQSNGSALLMLGARFGNVLVGVQPSFGYEGDPMRLLFEKGLAPTHAFSAFYRYLREDFGADAVLHFGTHGALEFLPGKQAGMTRACWPDRLIGDLPNLYLYAANNPSEGTIAKRRAAATLLSYMTPPVAHAGLYRGLVELKDSLERWRGIDPQAADERASLRELIRAQAVTLDLADADDPWPADAGTRIDALRDQVREMEYTLIPHGLHVVGRTPDAAERADYLAAIADADDVPPARDAVDAIAGGASVEPLIADGTSAAQAERLRELARINELMTEDHELPALLRALDGRFVRPAPGGDLLRTPEVLPTGRNLHGFDPYRIPSAYAIADGARQAGRLLERHADEGHGVPQSVAMVLWGTDNLKSEGGPIAQVMALIGARPRFDSFGRLCGAELVPLDELGRPRVDVVVTLSGIFRDLLPLQTQMLAEAALLAASVDEPVAMNPIRRHALAYMDEHGCDIETAALRVFSNADGAYGANVNHLIDGGCWQDDDELAEAYSRRKCFAYGTGGKPVARPELLNSLLGGVELAYQNLESVELGVTTVDHYFDTLGGINRAVSRAQGDTVPVYIGDQTTGAGSVRTLGEQVALEARTRALNPKWFESMLEHGYEGVRQIEAHVTNTMGWSATTGQVAPWVYQQFTQTFVLDEDMRQRLAELNPKASVRLANRLMEATERDYWSPDESMLEALRRAGEELEDRLEGIGPEVSVA